MPGQMSVELVVGAERFVANVAAMIDFLEMCGPVPIQNRFAFELFAANRARWEFVFTRVRLHVHFQHPCNDEKEK